MATHPRRLAAAGAAGAAGLLAHLAARPLFGGHAAWQRPAASPVPTDLATTAYHLVEAVPVVLALAGVLAVEQVRSPPVRTGRQDGESSRQDGESSRQGLGSGRREREHVRPAARPGSRRIEVTRRAAYALTVGGAHATIYANVAAHLLPAVPGPVAPASDALAAAYLGSWLVVGVGLGAYGAAVLAAGDAPATGASLAATPPAGLIAGAALLALGVAGLETALKLPFALASTAAAAGAWTASGGEAATTTGRSVE